MLTSAIFGLFPLILPSCLDPKGSLTIANSATAYSLNVALYWWLPGIALATVYFVFLYRRFSGKVQLS